jgi:hypothetical protein
MKNLILISFLIAANVCFSQNLQFPMSSEGVVEYYEKVSSPNNKDVLCQKIELWSQFAADTPDSIERKEDTTIFRKNMLLSKRYTPFEYFEERIYFTIQVVCQDSQYRYWIKDILFRNMYERSGENYDSTQTLTLLINEFIKTNKEIAFIENNLSIGKMKKKSKLDIPKMEAAKNSISLTNISHLMNAVIASLKEQME